MAEVAKAPVPEAAGPEAELPKAVVRRIVKGKLASMLGQKADEKKGGMQINADALLAFSEGARVFISYLTSTALDISKESKRQTIMPEDIFKACEELDFGEFVQPLRDYLAAAKAAGKEKSAKKKAEASSRKRKSTADGKEQQEGAAAAQATEADAAPEAADGAGPTGATEEAEAEQEEQGEDDGQAADADMGEDDGDQEEVLEEEAGEGMEEDGE